MNVVLMLCRMLAAVVFLLSAVPVSHVAGAEPDQAPGTAWADAPSVMRQPDAAAENMPGIRKISRYRGPSAKQCGDLRVAISGSPRSLAPLKAQAGALSACAVTEGTASRESAEGYVRSSIRARLGYSDKCPANCRV